MRWGRRAAPRAGNCGRTSGLFLSLADVQAQFGCHRLEIGKAVSQPSWTFQVGGGGAHFHNQFRQQRKHELGDIFVACPDMISADLFT